LLSGKCLTKNHCSYNIDCIAISYKLQETDNINVGLFSLQNGKLMYKFNEM